MKYIILSLQSWIIPLLLVCLFGLILTLHPTYFLHLGINTCHHCPGRRTMIKIKINFTLLSSVTYYVFLSYLDRVAIIFCSYKYAFIIFFSCLFQTSGVLIEPHHSKLNFPHLPIAGPSGVPCVVNPFRGFGQRIKCCGFSRVVKSGGLPAVIYKVYSHTHTQDERTGENTHTPRSTLLR